MDELPLKNEFFNSKTLKIEPSEIYRKIYISLDEKKPPKKADAGTLVEMEDFEKGKQECQLELLKTEITGLRGLLKWRPILTGAIFLSVQVWMGIIFHIIFWQGGLQPGARLNDNIIIALLMSVSIDIIGLLYLLIKYILDPKFYQNNNKK